MTVRRALQTLENEHLIYRSQGLGSFVTDIRSHQPLVRLTDFVEDMEQAGMQASSKVIKMEKTTLPAQEATLLNLKKGDPSIRLDRQRLGDDKAIAFDITWLPMFYGQLVEGYDLETQTIYSILEDDFQIPIQKGCYRIEAENANNYVARHLNVSQGQALLSIDRISYTIGDKPVYYQRRYYRSDRVVYQLLLEREASHLNTMPIRELSPKFKE